MFAWVTGLMRLASVIACLIVVVAFALFVVNQAGEASTHQLETLGASGPAGSKVKATVKATLRTRIDEVSNKITSPFSGITSGSSSRWTINGVNLLLTLVVYGFGVGFLVRVLRMH